MAKVELFGEIYDDDDEPLEEYFVIATFPAQFNGICAANREHAYKRKDIVGKLERTDNPFLPVQGVCCNRCVRTITHKKSVT